MSGDALMLSVSGLRGVMGTSLTAEVAQRFAGALADWVKAGRRGKGRATIVLGRDGRRGSDVFSSLARAAVLARGVDVLDLDIAMTPTVGVVVDRSGADAGLVVTASHNPQMWCGLKPVVRLGGARAGVVSASAPGKGTANELIAAFGGARAPTVGSWETVGHARVEREENHTHLVVLREALGGVGSASVKRLARSTARVVVDNLGMSGAVMSDWALRTLCPKADVRQVYESSSDLEQRERRGLFPHAAEPTRENLAGLGKTVKRLKGDVGFAQDPDADRLAIVDERGAYIGEEYTLVLAALALAEMGELKKGSKIAVNLSTSRMIEDVAARLGATVIRTAVGEANVVEAMKREKCVLGGEGNGGVIWPKVTYIRDSLSAMALVLGLMQATKKRVSELAASVPAYAIVKRKVDLAKPGDAQPALEALARAYAKERVDRQDGVRIDWDARRAWLHVRASNTEPIMRLIAEAPTAREAEAVLAAAEGVIARG